MKKIKKILLKSTGVFGQSNEDIFLNLDVNRSVKELKPDRFDNNFDLQKQFENERNASRNFFIYGTIDPIVELGDNFEIELYAETTKPTPSLEDQLVIVDKVDRDIITLDNGAELTFVKAIETRDLTYQTGNIFGSKKKEFGESLSGYTSTDQEVIYLFVKGNLDTLNLDAPAIPDQIFRQRLVFFDGNDDPIDYGSDTQEIRGDGSTFAVNNDFPFFYNIHWIKFPLVINQVTRLTVNFDQTEYFSIEGETINISLSLDRPSINGNEIVKLDISNITTSNSDYIVDTELLSWDIGDQEKVFTIQITQDNEIETIEFLEIKLTDPSNVVIGNKDTASIDILTDGVKNSVVYDFQNMYKNLLSFGKTLPSGNPSLDDEFKSSVLRNGITFDQKDSESFYYTEKFSLEIKNHGNFTVLPVIPGVNDEERVLRPGESFNIDLLNNTFEDSSNLHELEIRIDIDQVNPNPAFVFINGFIFENVRTPEELNAKMNAVNDSISFEYFFEEIFEDIDGNEAQFGLDGEPIVPIAVDSGGNSIVLDKYLVVKSFNSYSPMIVRNLQTNNSTAQFSVEEIETFNDPIQNPFQIKLFSNKDNGETCFYEFILTQKNASNSNIPIAAEYKEVVIPSTFLESKEIPDTVYLTSEYMNINRPYSGTDCIDPAIINEPGEESIGNTSVNGVLFLATQNNVTESFKHEFKLAKVSVEGCTINGGTNNFMGGFKI